jgi:glyoxylase-like metal-dependent hydrolase (beta-lactamase superfamily II)
MSSKRMTREREVDSSSWFVTKQVEPGVYLISEPPHVNSFLILGDHDAILFDTGMGFANIRDVVSELTDREVLVVNSHYHFDHSGGNQLFERLAIHESGVKPLSEDVPAEWLTAYMDFSARMLEKFKIYRELDEAFFHLLSLDMFPRPFPERFDPSEWTVVPTVASRALKDGDVLELGGRSLEVIHTPGHTPDCICLLDRRSGALFVGDTLCAGPHYNHLPDSDVDASAVSTRRLATEFYRDVNVVYPCHILRYALDPKFIVEVADGFQAMIEGRAERDRGLDIFNEEAGRYRFNRFSIFVPPGWQPDAASRVGGEG